MRTFNTILGKRNSVDSFNTLMAFSLSVNEMNYVRGGGDPTGLLGGPVKPSDDFIRP